MKIKVSEATNLQLDWLVAQLQVAEGVFTDAPEAGSLPGEDGLPFVSVCHGRPYLWGHGCIQVGTFNAATGKPWVFHGAGSEFSPSTDWAQGGPIIEREQILFAGGGGAYYAWLSNRTKLNTSFSSPTHLIAACRCYVASKLGDEVEIPEELT